MNTGGVRGRGKDAELVMQNVCAAQIRRFETRSSPDAASVGGERPAPARRAKWVANDLPSGVPENYLPRISAPPPNG